MAGQSSYLQGIAGLSCPCCLCALRKVEHSLVSPTLPASFILPLEFHTLLCPGDNACKKASQLFDVRVDCGPAAGFYLFSYNLHVQKRDVRNMNSINIIKINHQHHSICTKTVLNMTTLHFAVFVSYHCSALDIQLLWQSLSLQHNDEYQINSLAYFSKHQ